MTGEAVNPYDEPESYYAPAFLLELDRGAESGSSGVPLPPAILRDVMEVKYEDSLDRIDTFQITINNWDSEKRRPSYFCRQLGEDPPYGQEEFEPGRRIRLLMGYERALRVMIRGYITSVDIQFPESGPSKLVVSGLNTLDQYRKQQFTWSWPDDGAATVTDSQIAKALARAADTGSGRPGLGTPVVVDKAASAREAALPHVFMNNQFPIEFLMQRARLLGYEVFAAQRPEVLAPGQKGEEYLYFGPTNSVTNVTYRLEWGKSLLTFHPVYGGAQQLWAVTVCGWDRHAKKRIEVKKTIKDIPQFYAKLDDLTVAFLQRTNRERVITDIPVSSKAEAEQLAIRMLGANNQQLIEASGSTIGLPDLRAGRMIEVCGAGRLFDRNYVLTSTTHVLNESGYRTSFNARWQPGPPIAH